MPAELRTPCEVEPRPYATMADVALILTDQAQALTCANGKIAAFNKIWTAAENRAAR